MLVAAQNYLRAKNVIPPGRYLRTDSWGTGRTQEKRRPDRSSAVPAKPQKKPMI